MQLYSQVGSLSCLRQSPSTLLRIKIYIKIDINPRSCVILQYTYTRSSEIHQNYITLSTESERALQATEKDDEVASSKKK